MSQSKYITLLTLLAAILVPSRSLRAQDAPAPAPAQPADATAPAEDPAVEVDLKALLSNPIPAHKEFKYLYQRRSWLAANCDDPMNYQVLAQEFAERGAYFSAIELAWFAEKMTDDAAIRERLQSRMNTWLKAASPINDRVEQARQLFDAGKSKEALEALLNVIQEHPYAERAHYELSNVQFRVYLQQAISFEHLMPVDMRAKLFRVLYEHLTFTIAIDPLYYDAYYLLGSIREMLPDAKEFLLATEDLTQKALTFNNEIVPIMELIEAGNHDPELFQKFGAGLEAVGVMDYAVFAYGCAIARGSKDPEVPKRRDALIQKYFKAQ